MSNIIFRLYTQHPIKKGKQVRLLLEATNPHTYPVYILSPRGIYESLQERPVVLKQSTQSLKSRPNGPARQLRVSDFAKVSPVSSHVWPIDLASLFAIPAPGDYHAQVNKKMMICLRERPSATMLRGSFLQPAKGSRSAAGLSKKRLATTVSDTSFTITSPASKISKLAGIPYVKQLSNNFLSEAAHLPDGLETTLTLLRELPAGLRPPMNCGVIGGTANDQAMIRNAHQAGYVLAVRARAGLAPDQRYQHWFGPFDQGRFIAVRNKLDKLIQDFQDRPFNYQINSNCPLNELANSRFNDFTITVCTAFLHIPETGVASQASRILHEHCHVSFNAIDLRRNIPKCEELARNRPSDTIDNAPTYEFFATV